MKNKLPKIKALLSKAQGELNSYIQTNKFTSIAQACEKTWMAFVLIIERKAHRELRASTEIRSQAKKLGLSYEYERCHLLHVYHYEGSPAISKEDVIERVEDGINMVRGLI